jgi:hypothetical protein
LLKPFVSRVKRSHAKRKVAALDMACADFGRHALGGFAGYGYHLERGIVVRRALPKSISSYSPRTLAIHM